MGLRQFNGNGGDIPCVSPAERDGNPGDMQKAGVGKIFVVGR